MLMFLDKLLYQAVLYSSSTRICSWDRSDQIRSIRVEREETCTLLNYDVIYMRAGHWQELLYVVCSTIHGSWYDYITIDCDTSHIAIYCDKVHWKCKNRADKQVVVHDLGSLNRSHGADHSADNLSENSLIQHSLSNRFEWYWWITKHTDVAAITSKWEMKFNGTPAF